MSRREEEAQLVEGCLGVPVRGAQWWNAERHCFLSVVFLSITWFLLRSINFSYSTAIVLRSRCVMLLTFWTKQNAPGISNGVAASLEYGINWLLYFVFTVMICYGHKKYSIFTGSGILLQRCRQKQVFCELRTWLQGTWTSLTTLWHPLHATAQVAPSCHMHRWMDSIVILHM